MQFSMLFVVLMGMGVTFAGLTCIILLTMLLGRVVAGLEKAPSDASAAAAPVPAPAPADAGVPDEIKAAIVAALQQEPEFRAGTVSAIDIRRA